MAAPAELKKTQETESEGEDVFDAALDEILFSNKHKK